MSKKSKKRKGDWIQTYTGKQFWPLDPRPEEVDIVDIAHSLSMQCRFNGHCMYFYSVAEHSVRAARKSDGSYNLPGLALLHDAAEAYLSDISRPVKKFLNGYKEWEHNLFKVILEKFDFRFPYFDESMERIHEVDSRLLATEARDLMLPCSAEWNLPFQPYDEHIVPLTSPMQAKREFLDLAFDLGLCDYCE